MKLRNCNKVLLKYLDRYLERGKQGKKYMLLVKS